MSEEKEVKLISHEEAMREYKEYLEKKNFNNWLSKKIPKGIAKHNPLYALTHPWVIFSYWKNHVVWAWQRVFRGWDDRVVWSIDLYLAEYIPEWIDKLKKDKYGVPMMMFESWEESLLDEVSIAKEKEYDEILDKISKGFRGYYDVAINVFEEKKEEEKLLFFKEVSFPLFMKYFSTLWD